MAFTGFWQRVAAHYIDAVIMIISIMLLSSIMVLSNLIEVPLLPLILLLGLIFSLGVLIPLRYGATLGKRILRLDITMEDGSRLNMKAALIRAIVQFIIPVLLIFGINYLLFDILNITESSGATEDDKAVTFMFTYLLWMVASSVLIMRSKKSSLSVTTLQKRLFYCLMKRKDNQPVSGHD